MIIKPQERRKDECHLSKKNLLAEKLKGSEDRQVFCNMDTIFSFQEMILDWERNARLGHGIKSGVFGFSQPMGISVETIQQCYSGACYVNM